ncbi:MAG: zinc ABC transporter substrate-binding protein [Lachnospiraceae bacterium]|nr:zinc ABC transporter substrate-binding protein [Lachnospiraceae bacterium]
MKKTIILFLAAILMVGCFSACSAVGSSNAKKQGELQIVTTIFPEYDWVMNILGENPGNAEVTMLLDTGVDLHSYQPTAADILKISTCDMFIYVGGESDGWVKDALKEATNKNMSVINLLDVLGDSVKEEEVVEGMQHEHDHDHDHEDGDEHDHDHEDVDHDHEDADHDHDHEHHHEDGEVEYDEHVWLSLRNAATLTEYISKELQRIDSTNAETYKKNADDYIAKLNALDAQYADAVAAAPVKTVLFGDRFPFRYLTDDYGLSYYAAFVGCSAETEASFETITFLAGKVDELSLHAVLKIEGKDQRIAETIIRNTKFKDQTILTMDSMQATTAKDVQNGANYLSIMEQNLLALTQALK